MWSIISYIDIPPSSWAYSLQTVVPLLNKVLIRFVDKTPYKTYRRLN
jgi:hypothetical protein